MGKTLTMSAIHLQRVTGMSQSPIGKSECDRRLRGALRPLDRRNCLPIGDISSDQTVQFPSSD